MNKYKITWSCSSPIFEVVIDADSEEEAVEMFWDGDYDSSQETMIDCDDIRVEDTEEVE